MGATIRFGDASHRTRRSPVITTAIIILNGLVFLLELTGGVAYLAHVGGFVLGMASAQIFESFRLIPDWET